MISLLMGLLVLAIIVYVVYLIINQIQLPPNIKNIVYLIVGVILLIWLLSYLGVYTLPR